MEFLIATQELCEMSYPADTVEVALVYTNTEKAKVWVCLFSWLCRPLSRFLAFQPRGVELLPQLLKYSCTPVIQTQSFQIPSLCPSPDHFP